MFLRKHWWLACSGGMIVVSAILALTLPRGHTLNTFGNFTGLLLMSSALVVFAANAIHNRGQVRVFWTLMFAGSFLWAWNQALWTWWEVFLRREVPDPFIGDVILFIHVVPFMAAIALRPHRSQEGGKLHLSTLNFLMLLIWWVFLYTFIVVPDQYVVQNPSVYSRNYDLLYLLEDLILLGAVGLLALTAHGGWRKIYWHLFAALSLYTFSSEAMNAAIARGNYYSGSIYDVPFFTSIAWLTWTGLLARRLDPAREPALPERSRWLAVAPRLAMAAILSLPVMGFWGFFADTAVPKIRYFRLLVTLAAMLVLGFFVFVRQFFLDHELVRLLQQSHESLENLQRLQSQLVQKEKLASLGQLVAGAAHEINNPLTAILGYSDLLAGSTAMNMDQISMAQKIGQQARRTRDLVSGLLSFAQQAPSEKARTDISSLLYRALQLQRLQLESRRIRVETQISADLPCIWGNPNQLLQCFLHIISNAMDALEEIGGGVLTVTGRQETDEVVLEFADSGPGMREPRRVFDPFYTTKAIGKGTGLGLSVTYGVVQDHCGQITCHNRPEGGAVFVLRFPLSLAAPPPEARAARV